MSNLAMWAPTYDPEAVQPMRNELLQVGFEELLTPEKVDEALGSPEGTVLVVINSVCGCAAGNARPGAMVALQNSKIPNRIATVFAGQDKLAVARLREHMGNIPPSSPFIALFEKGKLVRALERRQIENRTADQVAMELIGWFNEHCSRPGPSIPREEFERVTPFKGCGSSIPLAGA
jgi:putative YphP/YqiW family bacilliredoxin